MFVTPNDKSEGGAPIGIKVSVPEALEISKKVQSSQTRGCILKQKLDAIPHRRSLIDGKQCPRGISFRLACNRWSTFLIRSQPNQRCDDRADDRPTKQRKE